MHPRDVLTELERLARRLGVEVRVDSFAPILSERRGGLCTLHGRPLVVMDVNLPTVDRIAILAEALAHFDLEPIYLPPILRARLSRR